MKSSRTLNRRAFFITTGGLPAILAACKTVEEVYPTGVRGAAAHLAGTQSALDETLGNLRTLTGAYGGNLKKPFKDYSHSLSKLRSHVKEAEKQAGELQSKGDTLLRSWGEEVAKMRGTTIQDASGGQRQLGFGDLRSIGSDYSELNRQLPSLMQDFGGAETALKDNLTSGGISAVRGMMPSITSKATSVSQLLAGMLGRFKALGVPVPAK